MTTTAFRATLAFLLGPLAIGSALVPVQAQAAHSAERQVAPAPEQDVWRLYFEPYAWMASIESGTDFGRLDLSVSDILEDVDVTLMFSLEAEKVGSPWSLLIDTVYLDLDHSGLEIQSTFITAAAGYRLFEDRPHRLLLGARYWDVVVDASPFGTNGDWVDPLIGFSTQHAFNEELAARLFLDAGGFGIGEAAEFTWEGMATLAYQLNSTFRMQLGYRYLDVDQDEDTKFDTTIKGPIAGLSVRL